MPSRVEGRKPFSARITKYVKKPASAWIIPAGKETGLDEGTSVAIKVRKLRPNYMENKQIKYSILYKLLLSTQIGLVVFRETLD